MLTAFQELKLTRLFTLYDTDQNGVIEAADYERIAQNYGKIRGWQPGVAGYDAFLAQTRGTWQALQQAADADHDNQVALAEWLAYMDTVLSTPDLYQSMVQATLDMMVNILDVDGDGAITLKDHLLSYQALGLPESLAETTFKRFDQNGDGKLSADELSKLVNEFYTSNDPAAAGNWLVGPL